VVVVHRFDYVRLDIAALERGRKNEEVSKTKTKTTFPVFPPPAIKQKSSLTFEIKKEISNLETKNRIKVL
jgi:hypothetical protein